MPNLGRQTDVLIKREVTRNTSETIGAKSIPWQDFDMNINNDEISEDSSLGLLDEVLFTDIQKASVEGKIKMLLDTDLIIDFLHYFFGQSTPTTALGATTWDLTLANNVQPPSFTVFADKADVGWKKAHGCAIKEIQIKAQAGGDASMEVNFVGINETAATSQTPSYTKPTRYMLGRYVKIGYAANLAGLSSATYFDAEEVTIKISRKTEEDFGLGALNPVDIFNGGFKVEVQFSAKVKAAIASYFDAAHSAGTKQAIRIEMVNTNAANIGSSSLKPTIRFDLPIGRFNVMTKISKTDLTKFDIDYIPEISITDGFTAKATVINATPSIV
jgi:hypothetical protein